MGDLSPRAIVAELDKYVVGQGEAKKAVAIALCNRERRRKLSPELRQGVMPKNIMLIGPTGVGKTEISRCLANIINAPFLKVEATRFTEVGYVGRDVESIIHELAEVAVSKVYQEKLKEVEESAEKLAAEKILDCLCCQMGSNSERVPLKKRKTAGLSPSTERRGTRRAGANTRRRVEKLLEDHQLDDHLIEIEVGTDEEARGILSSGRMELGDTATLFGEYDRPQSLSGNGVQRRKVSVKEARRILAREEANKLLDFEQLTEQALNRAEEDAVIFIDEVDKLVAPRIEVGRDISGEGVQRGLLPFLEGTTVPTRWGTVKTDHMLFIAAGTFSQSRPTDLIPELQGRFPLQVELAPLSRADLMRILVEPQNSLLKQYEALLATEEVTVKFLGEGIEEIARIATLMNERMENTGARRLHSVVEKTLEELNFTASDRKGEIVTIDAEYVSRRAGCLATGEALGHYIM